MSMFGCHQCPNCGSTWVGSVGWDIRLWEMEEYYNKVVASMCGCTDVDDPEYPKLSASVMGFKESDKRKELMKERSPDKDS